jgi:hypothetical protein
MASRRERSGRAKVLNRNLIPIVSCFRKCFRRGSRGRAKCNYRTGRRFVIRTTTAAAVERKKKETTLAMAIRIMEQDSNLGNLHIHEGLLHEILEDLETAHHVLMIRESLDINREPEKSYMSEFEGRVSRRKHRKFG